MVPLLLHVSGKTTELRGRKVSEVEGEVICDLKVATGNEKEVELVQKGKLEGKGNYKGGV